VLAVPETEQHCGTATIFVPTRRLAAPGGFGVTNNTRQNYHSHTQPQRANKTIQFSPETQTDPPRFENNGLVVCSAQTARTSRLYSRTSSNSSNSSKSEKVFTKERIQGFWILLDSNQSTATSTTTTTTAKMSACYPHSFKSRRRRSSLGGGGTTAAAGGGVAGSLLLDGSESPRPQTAMGWIEHFTSQTAIAFLDGLQCISSSAESTGGPAAAALVDGLQSPELASWCHAQQEKQKEQNRQSDYEFFLYHQQQHQQQQHRRPSAGVSSSETPHPEVASAKHPDHTGLYGSQHIPSSLKGACCSIGESMVDPLANYDDDDYVVEERNQLEMEDEEDDDDDEQEVSDDDTYEYFDRQNESLRPMKFRPPTAVLPRSASAAVPSTSVITLGGGGGGGLMEPKENVQLKSAFRKNPVYAARRGGGGGAKSTSSSTSSAASSTCKPLPQASGEDIEIKVDALGGTHVAAPSFETATTASLSGSWSSEGGGSHKNHQSRHLQTHDFHPDPRTVYLSYSLSSSSSSSPPSSPQRPRVQDEEETRGRYHRNRSYLDYKGDDEEYNHEEDEEAEFDSDNGNEDSTIEVNSHKTRKDNDPEEVEWNSSTSTVLVSHSEKQRQRKMFSSYVASKSSSTRMPEGDKVSRYLNKQSVDVPLKHKLQGGGNHAPPLHPKSFSATHRTTLTIETGQ
jgi:hypothetical protein